MCQNELFYLSKNQSWTFEKRQANNKHGEEVSVSQWEKNKTVLQIYEGNIWFCTLFSLNRRLDFAREKFIEIILSTFVVLLCCLKTGFGTSPKTPSHSQFEFFQIESLRDHGFLRRLKFTSSCDQYTRTVTSWVCSCAQPFSVIWKDPLSQKSQKNVRKKTVSYILPDWDIPSCSQSDSHRPCMCCQKTQTHSWDQRCCSWRGTIQHAWGHNAVWDACVGIFRTKPQFWFTIQRQVSAHPSQVWHKRRYICSKPSHSKLFGVICSCWNSFCCSLVNLAVMSWNSETVHRCSLEMSSKRLHETESYCLATTAAVIEKNWLDIRIPTATRAVEQITDTPMHSRQNAPSIEDGYLPCASLNDCW